ncbi:pyrroloquinoline quinone biosynthesis peptide chaperone PqqD [uncultured Tateyamaria sp.]|uniref:pyrroloquinoline quinone biosynthesis peptide chaperone PqqD n=1 Tax=uncultured Tateyamaria sp. TaxID=455651 RepID=UPI002615826F|nr:pyrroloquinoline quinone biosynthesis peptide chaperone PqqD [uncultured Tateyamaria sp.]
MTQDDVPYLPRGVRTRFDTVRKVDVLLGPERVLVLDQVGTAVLGRLDGKANLAQISTDLAEVYDAPLEVIAPDVIAFVEDLRDRGMVHARPR